MILHLTLSQMVILLSTIKERLEGTAAELSGLERRKLTEIKMELEQQPGEHPARPVHNDP